MINENNIEQAIIDVIKADHDFRGYEIKSSLLAMNPSLYDFTSAAGGTILISCVGTDYTGAKQFRNLAGVIYRVIVSIGILGATNEKMWTKKANLLHTLAFKKPLPETGKLTPISDTPLFPEAVDKVFWIKIEFDLKNYTGILT